VKNFSSALAMLILSWPVSAAQSEPLPRGNNDGIRLLNSLAGGWSCTGRFANGTPLDSTLQFTRDLDGLGLHVTHADRPPNKYRAEETWAVDKTSGRLLSLAWVGLQGSDQRSASLFVSDQLSPTGVTLVQQQLLQPPWTPNRFRYVLHRKFLQVYWERQQGGEWILGDYLECEPASANRARRQ
jgi:hypothetical protein